MKLILESQDILRIRLSQSELQNLEAEGFLENSFRMLGNINFRFKVVTEDQMDKKLLRLTFSDSLKSYEVLLASEGIELLKKPSKKGIESLLETTLGPLHLAVEVDLKRDKQEGLR